MFGNFAGLASLPRKAPVDPNDVPPPTPISIPRYQPFAQDEAPADGAHSLSELLKQTSRVATALSPVGLSAIGLDLVLDAPLRDLIPDPSAIPDTQGWDSLNSDQAREMNQSTRRSLRNGGQSPGCQVYLERKKELLNTNEDAFRTVRRISPPKGKQHARLGNAYEFYRCLELLTSYWDDPTQPLSLPPSPEMSAEESASVTESSAGEADPGEALPSGEDPPSNMRMSAGHSMPPEYRTNVVTAFIKLVAYDFCCNVSMARLEPRLQLSSASPQHGASRKTYIPSHCAFIYQSPATREAARAGILYGPVAAISTRPTTSFDIPDVESAQSLDLSREIVVALITAQHRARQGREEARFGQEQWWTTKKRWGGGPGGPISRETQKDAVAGDKDARPSDADGLLAPAAKKSRKTTTMYENYRQMRPPASTWDKKTSYQSIGRSGGDFDDIFVVSSLFHHLSILRVRAPDRLLAALEGAPEPDPAHRSWGKVPAWRSPWFDLFDAEQRVAAMRTIWAVMAYQMRRIDDNDVKMENT